MVVGMMMMMRMRMIMIVGMEILIVGYMSRRRRLRVVDRLEYRFVGRNEDR